LISYLSFNAILYLIMLPYWVRLFNLLKFYLEFLSILIIIFLMKNNDNLNNLEQAEKLTDQLIT
jgi:hypothetical protein